MPSQQQQKLLIGTGIDKIYSASFCSETGRITVDNEKCHIASGKGPTWLLPTSNKLRLYAVNEHEDKIQVFDKTTTEDDDGCTPSCCWRKSSEFSAGGETPCYLEFVPGSNEKSFVCANYNKNMTLFEQTASTNEVKPAFVADCSKKVTTTKSDEPDDEPVGPQKDRQEKSHPHMAKFVPSSSDEETKTQFILVPDLGTDSIAIVRRQVEDETNKTTTTKIIDKVHTSKSGMGPRHLIFHPGAYKNKTSTLYLVNELASSVTVFSYHRTADDSNIKLKEGETFSCLPPGKSSFNYGGSDFERTIEGTSESSPTTTATNKVSSPTSFGVAQNTCASINIDPVQGKFLYVSCRGRDVITGFELDAETGNIIQCVGEFPTFGRTPRFFCFSNCGKFVIVLNQDSDSVVVFKFNQENGEFELPPVCVVNGVKSPQCLVFV